MVPRLTMGEMSSCSAGTGDFENAVGSPGIRTALPLLILLIVAACVEPGGPSRGSNSTDHIDRGRTDPMPDADANLSQAIRSAVGTGAISAEQGQSEAIRAMFAREGLVVGGQIHPPPGEHVQDYSALGCGEADRRNRWMFLHWFAHIWQDQNRDMTGYRLGEAVAEHDQLGDRVYDYERPPTRPLLSYRYEQQAAIMADYGLLQSCGDPNGWLPAYQAVVKDALG